LALPIGLPRFILHSRLTARRRSKSSIAPHLMLVERTTASLVPVQVMDPPTTLPSPWIRMDTTSKPLLVVLGKPNSQRRRDGSERRAWSAASTGRNRWASLVADPQACQSADLPQQSADRFWTIRDDSQRPDLIASLGDRNRDGVGVHIHPDESGRTRAGRAILTGQTMEVRKVRSSEASLGARPA
jgi:hypothetical protein